jgi:ATP-dependent DNA helicase RecG
MLRFVEAVANEEQKSLSTSDLLVLHAIRRERPIPEQVKSRISRLLELGLVERAGRGKLLLAKRFHAVVGTPGEYTRRKGLDRPTQKALLLNHIRGSGPKGSPLKELCQVLPQLSSSQVQKLVRSMKEEGTIHSVGRTRAGRWVYGQSDEGATE